MRRSEVSYLIVFLGGGIGTAMRHGVNRASLAIIGPGLPVGTLIVNVIGSTLMGLIVGWLTLRGGEPSGWRLFLATGILGGFTTFSAFTYEAVDLWQRGEQMSAAGYVLASVAFSIAGLLIGLVAARSLA